MAKKKTYSDEELKQKMLEDIFRGTSFRDTFKDDFETCMRCWDFLRKDKEFKKRYNEILEMRLSGMEEDIISGKILENIPRKVDRQVRTQAHAYQSDRDAKGLQSGQCI